MRSVGLTQEVNSYGTFLSLATHSLVEFQETDIHQALLSYSRCSQAPNLLTTLCTKLSCEVSSVENRGKTHRANYRCQVSGWKVHFWCFLWKRRRAATGCGGILCGLPTSSPPGSCERSPFSMIIN